MSPEELGAKLVGIQRWYIVEHGASRENIETCTQAAAFLVAVILVRNTPERRQLFNALVDQAFELLHEKAKSTEQSPPTGQGNGANRKPHQSMARRGRKRRTSNGIRSRRLPIR